MIEQLGHAEMSKVLCYRAFQGFLAAPLLSTSSYRSLLSEISSTITADLLPDCFLTNVQHHSSLHPTIVSDIAVLLQSSSLSDEITVRATPVDESAVLATQNTLSSQSRRASKLPCRGPQILPPMKSHGHVDTP